jgi:hypothetical protein
MSRIKTMELQLVVLLPHQFLPDGQALLRRNDDHGLTPYTVTNDGTRVSSYDIPAASCY